mgnify:CR=1 FL=1
MGATRPASPPTTRCTTFASAWTPRRCSTISSESLRLSELLPRGLQLTCRMFIVNTLQLREAKDGMSLGTMWPMTKVQELVFRLGHDSGEPGSSMSTRKTGQVSLADLAGAQPLYRQIYERLRAAITAGALQPGDRIPSARALTQELGLARGTIDAAYSLLASTAAHTGTCCACAATASASPRPGAARHACSGR